MRARALLPLAAIAVAAFADFAQAQDSIGYRPAPPNALQGGFSPSAPQPATAQPARPQQEQAAPPLDPWNSFAPVNPGGTAGNVTCLHSVTASAF